MESLLLVCIVLMFSFYSLDKFHLWYSSINFCVVSQRINLPYCAKIQISVVLLSVEHSCWVFFRLKVNNIKCKSSFLFCPLYYWCRQRYLFFPYFSGK